MKQAPWSFSRRKLRSLMAAGMLAGLPGFAAATMVSVTINGVYQDTGAAPSPTSNFTLSFNVERTPGVCGGGVGSSILCNASQGHYVDGSLDTMLGTSVPPTVLVRDAAHGGGLSFFQDDLPLNRLYFILGSSQLFSGSLGSPTLVDGVYSILPNSPCVLYVSYAGQSFASGDPINNPFHDPGSLQSYDPLVSGTITISGASAGEISTAVPQPGTVPLFVTGLGVLGWAARRRSLKVGALAA
jgi:hypothetical protein